jgi:branched-chain amino acid transport system substrate-binding protein
MKPGLREDCMKLTRRDFAAGIAAGIAAPHILTSARAQGATLKIGMCAPVTGPAAESGGYAIKGAKLALEAVNKAGGVLGKQLELIVEDDQVRSARPRFTPWRPTSSSSASR